MATTVTKRYTQTLGPMKVETLYILFDGASQLSTTSTLVSPLFATIALGSATVNIILGFSPLANGTITTSAFNPTAGTAVVRIYGF